MIQRIIILLCITSSLLYAQDNIKFQQNRWKPMPHYYGNMISYNIGYEIRRNSFSTIPYIGLSTDVINGLSTFATGGILFKFNSFFVDIAAIQQITPSISQGFSAKQFENINSIGQMKIGYHFDKLTLESITKIGLIGQTNRIGNNHYNIHKELALYETFAVRALLFDDSISRIAAKTTFSFYALPIIKQFWYSIDVSIPFIFQHAHGWLELGIKADLSFVNYFKDSKRTYEIDKKATSYRCRFGSKVADIYQMSTSIEIEYRLFWKFLPAEFSRFYFAIFTSVGYGKPLDSDISQGRLFYLYGGGIGYHLFDNYPIQLQFGVDNRNSFLFNIRFSSPIYITP